MVRAIGPSGKRDELGAKVYVTAGGVTQVREVRTGNSYASHNDLRAHFGLGEHTAEVLGELKCGVWEDVPASRYGDAAKAIEKHYGSGAKE